MSGDAFTFEVPLRFRHPQLVDGLSLYKLLREANPHLPEPGVITGCRIELRRDDAVMATVEVALDADTTLPLFTGPPAGAEVEP